MDAMREGLNCPRCGAASDDQNKRYHCTQYYFAMSCRSCRYEWKYQLPKDPVPAPEDPFRRQITK